MFQLGSALLDACVLAVVSHEDTYGYQLTQEIRNIIEVSESTLYPVLRRLQQEQKLVTYDMAFSGRNRRYYQITPYGREHLEYLRANWQHFKTAVDYLLIVSANKSNREVSNEEANNWEASDGEARNEDVSNEDVSSEEVSSEEAGNGEASDGEASTGEAGNGGDQS